MNKKNEDGQNKKEEEEEEEEEKNNRKGTEAPQVGATTKERISREIG